MEWCSVVVPTGDPIVREHLAARTHTHFTPSRDDDECKHRPSTYIQSKALRAWPDASIFIRSRIGTIDWLSRPGGHCCTWRALRSTAASPLFPTGGLEIRPGKRGPWDMVWQNVELATILQDVGSRPGDSEQELLCLVVRGNSQPLGWSRLGGRDAAMIPWLECSYPRAG